MITKLIAEIGWNHMGNMDTASQMIIQASKSGAEYAKFQTWKVDRLTNGEWDSDGRREIYENAELSEEQHVFLKDICKQNSIKFLSSAFSIEDAELLKKIGCKEIKIPSFECSNYELITYCQYNFDLVIISTGTATKIEIEKLSNLFEDYKKELVVMHCVSAYPCEPSFINLPRILKLNKYFKKVGFSDHTQGIMAAMASLKYSPVAIEKHFTIDKNLPGRDNKFAILPEELNSLSKYLKLFNDFDTDNGLDYIEQETSSRDSYRGRFNG